MTEEKLEKKFTVDDFTAVCRFVNCADEDSFQKMYASFLHFAARYYTCEKLRSIRSSNNGFLNWWCELDRESQESIIEFVKNERGQA